MQYILRYNGMTQARLRRRTFHEPKLNTLNWVHEKFGNQLAIYKRGRGFELGMNETKSSKWPERDSNPGPPDYESDALTTRPRCLL